MKVSIIVPYEGYYNYLQDCLESIQDQKIKDVQEHDVDIFVMGDDWKGQFDFLKDYCEVVYLPRTEGISTTKIKEDLKDKL